MRRSRGALSLLSALTIIACSEPTGSGLADGRFNGSWQYRAQVAGSAVTVQGTLTLADAERGTLNGALSAEQVDAVNQRTPLAGLVSGAVVSVGVATINVTLPGGEVRTHFTQWRNDSLIGDWSVQSGGSGGGTFRAGRSTP